MLCTHIIVHQTLLYSYIPKFHSHPITYLYMHSCRLKIEQKNIHTSSPKKDLVQMSSIYYVFLSHSNFMWQTEKFDMAYPFGFRYIISTHIRNTLYQLRIYIWKWTCQNWKMVSTGIHSCEQETILTLVQLGVVKVSWWSSSSWSPSLNPMFVHISTYVRGNKHYPHSTNCILFPSQVHRQFSLPYKPRDD